MNTLPMYEMLPHFGIWLWYNDSVNIARRMETDKYEENCME